MPTHEHTINDALATLLRTTRYAWRTKDIVRSENTGMLRGSAARPDIIVLEPDVSPVVIEAESLPASSVEHEAVSRIGENLRKTGRRILSAIAVRYPHRLSSKQGEALNRELVKMNDLDIVLYTGTKPENSTRWPQSGWIRGSVSDLSILTQSASVPPEVIESAADELVTGVSEAAGLLEEISHTQSGAVLQIAKELCQEDSLQTRRMATTILANAFVFQESLAGGPGKLSGVKGIEQLRGSKTGLNKASVLREWRKILAINYWPIFDIARRILEVIPTEKCRALINRLSATADKLLENRLMRSHDLTGAVFQRLIADRKFLAAFYTTPASASLLIGLAVIPDCTPNGSSWKSAEDVKALRIADFACGTGTLLSTAYQRVGQLHELYGGDSESLHPDMIAHSLVGCDVLPAAAHLTASMLSGAHPTVQYSGSSVMTLAYGKQPKGGIALGSLDLLNEQRELDILNITARAAEGMGESERELWLSIPHASFDLVVMNPPFTRSTGHEGGKIGVPRPMFAAFASSKEEQRQMSEATRKLTVGTSAHGNAGEASIFLILADRKLRQGGTLALVMPLSLMSGDSWEESRRFIATKYSYIVLVSIAGGSSTQISFSADTGMGECLLCGQKRIEGSKRATFVVLNARPSYPLVGLSAAKQIRSVANSTKICRLEDGPIGGSRIEFGDQLIGQAIDAPLPEHGGWHLNRIMDFALAQSAYQLGARGVVWLPTQVRADAIAIPIVPLNKIGSIGPYHMDINAVDSRGGIRGPFKISEIHADFVPTYPVLWAHDAGRERAMSFEADCEGLPLKGRSKSEQEIIDLKVAAVFASASHSHFNRDFRFNSQSTSMQFTTRKTIGGRAWLSISLQSPEQEKALVVWANSTLGLLMYWWHSNKQQSGRGTIGKSRLESMPILDVTKLTSKQVTAAVQVFDDMCNRPMLPIHEIDQDPVRKELDDRFGQEVLGLPETLLASDGPLDLLRKKMAREPSIRGGK